MNHFNKTKNESDVEHKGFNIDSLPSSLPIFFNVIVYFTMYHNTLKQNHDLVQQKSCSIICLFLNQNSHLMLSIS